MPGHHAMKVLVYALPVRGWQHSVLVSQLCFCILKLLHGQAWTTVVYHWVVATSNPKVAVESWGSNHGARWGKQVPTTLKEAEALEWRGGRCHGPTETGKYLKDDSDSKAFTWDEQSPLCWLLPSSCYAQHHPHGATDGDGWLTRGHLNMLHSPWFIGWSVVSKVALPPPSLVYCFIVDFF